MVFGRKKKVHATLDVVLPRSDWHAGEYIEGTVIFHKDQPMKIAYVRVGILAEEKAKSPETEKVKVKKVFEYVPVTIFGSKARQEAGESTYGFRIKLPDSSPPSAVVAGRYAVKYDLLAEAGFPNSKDTLSTSKKLQVHGSKAEEPEPAATFTDKKTFKFKALSLKCTPDKSSYEAGETMSLDLALENKTTKEVGRLIVTCDQRVKYANKKDDFTISTLEVTQPKLPLRPGSSYQEVLLVDIPRDAPPSLKGPNLTVSYTVGILCEFASAGSWSTKLPVEITRPVGGRREQEERQAPQVINIESQADILRQKQEEEQKQAQQEQLQRQQAQAQAQAQAQSRAPQPQAQAPPGSQIPQHILDANPNLNVAPLLGQVPQFTPERPPLTTSAQNLGSQRAAMTSSAGNVSPAVQRAPVAAAPAVTTMPAPMVAPTVAHSQAAAPEPVAFIPPSVAAGGKPYPYGHPVYYGGEVYEPRMIPLQGQSIATQTTPVSFGGPAAPGTPPVPSRANQPPLLDTFAQQQHAQQQAQLQAQQQQLQQQMQRANLNSSQGAYPSLDNLVNTDTGNYSLMSNSSNAPPAYNPESR